MIGRARAVVCRRLALVGPAWARRAGRRVGLALIGPSLARGATVGARGRHRPVQRMSGYLGQDLATVWITDDQFCRHRAAGPGVAAWRLIDRIPGWAGAVANTPWCIRRCLAPLADPLGHSHNYYLNVWPRGLWPGRILDQIGAALVRTGAARRSSGWQRACPGRPWACWAPVGS
jgi:hypothetical protein